MTAREAAGATPLAQFRFTDIYLTADSARFKGTDAGKASLTLVPGELAPLMPPLHEQCVAAQRRTGSLDFALDFEGVRFRVARMETVTGACYVLRRFPDRIPNLLQLGLPGWMVRQMVAPEVAGLIAIVGATGSGKTTTASALVKFLLEQYGGVAVAIEDPPEMPLHGTHGKGTCFQVEVIENDYAARCRAMLRWHPEIILLGEVRDPATASEALRASINGHRVICTVHASGVQAGIERLHTLAAAMNGSEDAANLLSNGLATVMFQRVVHEPSPHLETEFLALRGQEGAPARSHIAQRNFRLLPPEVESQRRRLDTLR